MLELVRKELDTKYDVFNGKLPAVINLLNQAIANPLVPTRMKSLAAISELTTFASQFRRNIWHWEGFELPVNSVGFLIAGSGVGKDSGIKAIRRAFKPAYQIINDKREYFAKQQAINLAREAGVDSPNEWENYKEFYNPPPPIYIAPTTPQGVLQHINDIVEGPLGSGTLFTGEIGDELASGGHIDEIIKTVAEIYDTGDKEVVYTKGKEFRSKEISSTPFSALFAGSPNYIIYDEGVKRKFLIAFGSKLARRSFFCYINERLDRKNYDSVQDMLDAEEKATAIANTAKEQISKEISAVAEYQLQYATTTIQLDPDIQLFYATYKRYNEELSDTMDPKYPLSKLVREHLQWKALKLAGALAIVKCNDTVTTDDYAEAVRLCEILDKDMRAFEIDLVKEPYEIFSDYMRSSTLDGKSSISLHNLRKAKYIPATANPQVKMTELVKLAASYDRTGVYSVTEHGIDYEEIRVTNTLNITYKEIDNTPIFNAVSKSLGKVAITEAKNQVASTTNSDLESTEATFADLGKMLEGDYAYSPFRFKDGKRTKEDLLPGTKWLVYDIDHSDITADEAHFLLQDINHHIALGSDPSNDMKFHILVELDSVVDVTFQVWNHFYASVAKELALNIDPLPQSQLFFSYSTSPVQSVTDGSTIAVRDHLMYAQEKAKEQSSTIKVLTTTQAKAALADPFTTFDFAYNCPNDGSGSRKLLGAARKAFFDLGASVDETIALIEDINDFWVSPMPESRLETTLFSQVRRWKHS